MIKKGDLITARCMIVYPSYIVKKDTKGEVVADITDKYKGVKWAGVHDKLGMNYDVVNVDREEIVPYFSHIDDDLFEI
jgi:hypothetical protein